VPLRLLIDPTGMTTSVNLIQASTRGVGLPPTATNVNSGLLTFTRYDIMYELRAGRIHFRMPQARP
jgi:hypothetical protein